jgi:non-specific serine/threonine protein kinase/serine/threonine-protein kinase
LAGDPETTARFRTERQVLASLDHPNIARLLDGGTLGDGQPYLVMDYIEGRPIDLFAVERKLETEAVLRLFLKVCSASQFAHQNLVIHRDLKAGNVLVSADGEPHLLDFGIAKLLNPTGIEMYRTQPWQRLLTPVSASPEQVSGGIVTTATDVYSLGVLLYSLLTKVPFYGGAKDFTTDPGRAVREYEPPPASDAPNLPTNVRRQLAGDLDTIVRKATAKDPPQRYATVKELANDIRLHLDGHPIAARPSSLVYRLRKFARRNRLLVFAAALLFLTIAVGTAGTAWYAYRARLAEARAERRFEELHRLTNSMLFEVDDALATMQGATAVRAAIINRTLQYLDQLASDSINNKAVLPDLATAYGRIGRIQGAQLTAHLGGPGSLQNARKSYQKALAIRRQLAAAEPRNRNLQVELIRTQAEINSTYQFEGDLDRVLSADQALVSKITAMADQSPGHDKLYVDMQYLKSAILTGMGEIAAKLGDVPHSLDCQREALRIRSALMAEHPGDKRGPRAVGISHNYFCRSLEAAHRYQEAVEEERLALANWEPLAIADPNNADLHSLLGDANEHLCADLARTGSFGEALQHCRTSLGIYQAAANADPNDVQAEEDLATSFNAMSETLDRMGKPRDAIGWESKARTLYRAIEVKNPGSLDTATNDATSLLHFGSLEAKLGLQAAAAKDLGEARDMLQRQIKQSPKNRPIQDLYEQAARLAATAR